MNRPGSRRSDISEPDNDCLAEIELSRLQRQYRLLENDRKAYFEESQNLVRKQKVHLESLKEESKEIETNLQLASSVTNEKKDRAYSEKIHSLVDDHDEYLNLIEMEKKSIKELDKEILTIETKVNEQYKNLGSCSRSQARHISTHKRLRILENRLYKATVGFNEMLGSNAELRCSIDHLTQDRHIFESLYKKLLKEQQHIKREMNDVIQQSTAAYDARDEAQTKMMALRDRSEKEQAQYNLELKELHRIIDHDRKLKEFMAIKAQERIEIKAIEAAKCKKKDDEKSNTRIHEEEMKSLDAIFERIKEVTGEKDLDALVRKFIDNENKNFALFNYVNELNNEVEMLQDQIHGIEQDIASFKKQGMKLDKNRHAIMKDLEAKCTEKTKEGDASETKLKHLNKSLGQMKSAILSLFRKAECDESTITEMLGSVAGISDKNVMLYLGSIEQKVSDLLLSQSYLQYKSTEKTKQEAAAAQAQQTSSICNAKLISRPQIDVSIVPPSLDDSIDSDDDLSSILDGTGEVQPLTEEELRRRTVKIVKRRQETVASKVGKTTENGVQNNKQTAGSGDKAKT
ncbi:coiled-coil domain-containing protein 63-like [Anneissia japonica]|uniref:coiled-coil domain-containing protein 63-like n=1 Tax=Anneissia japonica TaxID=1529436 RepID=UPI001425B1EA|nr:coiled-coil domain-containing protein 63-like [Anneissia japonica]